MNVPEAVVEPEIVVAVVDPTLTHAGTDSSSLSSAISMLVADCWPRLSILTDTSNGSFGSGISGVVFTDPDLNLSIGDSGLSSTVNSKVNVLSEVSSSPCSEPGSILISTE